MSRTGKTAVKKPVPAVASEPLPPLWKTIVEEIEVIQAVEAKQAAVKKGPAAKQAPLKKKAKQAAVKDPAAKQAPLKKKGAPKAKATAPQAPVDTPRSRPKRVPNLNAGFPDLSKVKFSGGARAALCFVAVGAAESRNLNMAGF